MSIHINYSSICVFSKPLSMKCLSSFIANESHIFHISTPRTSSNAVLTLISKSYTLTLLKSWELTKVPKEFHLGCARPVHTLLSSRKILTLWTPYCPDMLVRIRKGEPRIIFNTGIIEQNFTWKITND